jgi:transposase-like protein
MKENPIHRLKNRYSDQKRAEALAALAANGGPQTRGAIPRTARQLGLPIKTLAEWARTNKHPDILARASALAQPLADRLEALAHRITGVLEDEAKLLSAPVSALATALAIAVDKMRLLREQATSLSSTITHSAAAPPRFPRHPAVSPPRCHCLRCAGNATTPSPYHVYPTKG